MRGADVKNETEVSLVGKRLKATSEREERDVELDAEEAQTAPKKVEDALLGWLACENGIALDRR